MRVQQYLFVLAASFAIAGCDPEISGSFGEDPDPGSVDFSTFIVVGDSLTAGYKDGALYREGQQNSYGAILAQQFALVGGGAFAQPLRLPEATGSFVGVPTADVADRFVLIPTGNPERPVSPARIVPSMPTPLLPALTGPFNNFGVPAAKSIYLGLNTFGDPNELGMNSNTANPFYVHFASSAGATVIGDAAARMPTFFILWIGNNDILLNAIAGSPGVDNPTFGTGLTDVTPTATFDAVYPGLVTALTTSMPGNKGVVANIPNVSTIPYFTTVPYNAIPLTAGEALQLNTDVASVYDLVLNSAVFNGLDPAEADLRRISFSEGQNPILISDDTLTDIAAEFVGPLAALNGLAQARQATADDLILLPASSKLGVEDTIGNPLTKWGVTLPLLDTDVLIKDEVDSLESVRMAYNMIIKDQADASSEILFFDAAALLDELNATGLSYGSGGISSAFIQGGGFSLDGIHPTARGYAVIANEILKVINEGFDAYIPPVIQAITPPFSINKPIVLID